MHPSTQLAATAVAFASIVPAFVTPTHAHHSFAAVYDEAAAIRVEGIVERIDWKNPHVAISLLAAGPDGGVRWRFEMGAPRVLTTQFGWSDASIRAGDRVVIEGARARNGSNEGAAYYVTTSGGRRLRAVRPFR